MLYVVDMQCVPRDMHFFDVVIRVVRNKSVVFGKIQNIGVYIKRTEFIKRIYDNDCG